MSCRSVLKTAALALLLHLCVNTARAEDNLDLEYQVKAAFLYNFAKFVEWPQSKFAQTQSPLTIGILGDDPFGSNIDRVIQGQSAHNRPIVIKRLQTGDNATECAIVFVSLSARKAFAGISDKLKSANVLTVGESKDFLDQGGIIRFTIEDRKVRFEINMDAAEAAQLKISSQLLKLARNVRAKTK